MVQTTPSIDWLEVGLDHIPGAHAPVEREFSCYAFSAEPFSSMANELGLGSFFFKAVNF